MCAVSVSFTCANLPAHLAPGPTPHYLSCSGWQSEEVAPGTNSTGLSRRVRKKKTENLISDSEASIYMQRANQHLHPLVSQATATPLRPSLPHKPPAPKNHILRFLSSSSIPSSSGKHHVVVRLAETALCPPGSFTPDPGLQHPSREEHRYPGDAL